MQALPPIRGPLAVERGFAAPPDPLLSSPSSSDYDTDSGTTESPAADADPAENAPASAESAPSSAGARRADHGERDVADFTFASQALGTGSYSVVKVATEVASGKRFAAKILEKAFIKRENKVAYVMSEKDILNMVEHPNVVELFWAFQDRERLYFVLELCPNGELRDLMQLHPQAKMPLADGIFYMAELVSALSHISSLGIVHRDVKPENMLISEAGHLKLSDFGTAKKIGIHRGARSSSFSGTAEYVAPELLVDKYTSLASDMWALGVCIFQIFSGRLPFKGQTEYQTFHLITEHEFDFDPDFPEDAANLVKELFVRDPDTRAHLGESTDREEEDVGDIYEWVRSNPLFSAINWSTLADQSPPPIPLPSEMRTQSPVNRTQVDAATHQNALQLARMAEWQGCLKPHERILHSGLVSRKRKAGTQKRMLLLVSKENGRPRLMFADPETHEVDSRIQWTKSLKARDFAAKGKPKHFDIVAADRSYQLTDLNGVASEWVKAITTAQASWAATGHSRTGSSASAGSHGTIHSTDSVPVVTRLREGPSMKSMSMLDVREISNIEPERRRRRKSSTRLLTDIDSDV